MIEKTQVEYEQWIGIYAIFDLKQEIYDSPFLAATDLNAKRRFVLMIDEENSVLNRWHNDYNLFKLAEFSTKTGEVKKDLKQIFEGKSYIKKGDRE